MAGSRVKPGMTDLKPGMTNLKPGMTIFKSVMTMSLFRHPALDAGPRNKKHKKIIGVDSYGWIPGQARDDNTDVRDDNIQARDDNPQARDDNPQAKDDGHTFSSPRTRCGAQE